MSDYQYRMALNTIEHNTGDDILSMPTVTTLSGRQAHFAAQDLQEIVIGKATNSIGLGPVLDVIPTVTTDGYSIQMVVIPTYTELLQFDQPGGPIPQLQSPLPHFRQRQVVTSCDVRDGQTLVIGVRSTNQPPDEKNLELIFVTSRIVDPAGNPAHSDEELSKRH